VTAEDAAALAEIQRRSYARASPGFRTGWPEAQALDAQGIGALLEERRYCVLATARPDGRAHASPVAFVVAGGAFWFGTVAGLRLRNLRATPWASLVVMIGERDEDETEGVTHRALTAEGPVAVYEGDARDRAFAPLREAWVARHGHEPAWAVALVELRPERIFSHSAA
jgi:nitroimidazol reductase NimA-like FMN-containing flavoprotein (pyridoxamine 5'-phosphate oxidase superfamily)